MQSRSYLHVRSKKSLARGQCLGSRRERSAGGQCVCSHAEQEIAHERSGCRVLREVHTEQEIAQERSVGLSWSYRAIDCLLRSEQEIALGRLVWVYAE